MPPTNHTTMAPVSSVSTPISKLSWAIMFGKRAKIVLSQAVAHGIHGH
jgi:hypothetical protein